MKGRQDESESLNSFFGGSSGVIIVVQQGGVKDNSSGNAGR